MPDYLFYERKNKLNTAQSGFDQVPYKHFYLFDAIFQQTETLDY